MLRVRFEANYDDPRPVSWPIKYPFWVTGSAGDESYSIVVAYADDEEYIYKNWPEAKNLDCDTVTECTFTDRFPKPDWFTNG